MCLRKSRHRLDTGSHDKKLSIGLALNENYTSLPLSFENKSQEAIYQIKIISFEIILHATIIKSINTTSLVSAYLETNAVFSIVITIIMTSVIIGTSSFLTLATSKSSWSPPLVISRTISGNSGAGFTMQATPFEI